MICILFWYIRLIWNAFFKGCYVFPILLNGLRPSFVQWIGPAYLGAGVSFVGSYYSNDQNENYELKVKNPKGRFDGFILYNVSSGSTAKDEMFSDWTSDGGRENYPGYAHRTNVLTYGISTFWKKKHPWGLYFEYSPEGLPLNEECGKFQIGWVFLY